MPRQSLRLGQPADPPARDFYTVEVVGGKVHLSHPTHSLVAPQRGVGSARWLSSTDMVIYFQDATKTHIRVKNRRINTLGS